MPKAKSAAKNAEAPRFERRKNRDVAVAGLLDNLLDGPLAQSSGLLRQIQRRWRQVCPLLGAQSWPIGLVGGNLRVAVQNSSVAQELKYQSPTVIAGTNLLAGSEVVEKVTTVVQSLPAASVQKTVLTPPAPAAGVIAAAGALCKSVADEGLRDALTRLGGWVYMEKKR
jgi:hypothetical protein